MEKEILTSLNFDMKHPKPTDFLERFSKAAKVLSLIPNLKLTARTRIT
jgi:hypothetical protein